MNNSKDLTVLSNVHETLISSPNASQRDISKALNMSLGMTNNILKRFVDKGWLYMHKISARNIRYVLTSEGLKEVAKRSYNYVKRTIKNVYDYKELILEFIEEKKSNGVKDVVLLGEDDVAFIFEYACQKNSLTFSNIKKIDQGINIDKNTLYLLSESEVEKRLLEINNVNVFSVIDVLMDN